MKELPLEWRSPSCADMIWYYGPPSSGECDQMIRYSITYLFLFRNRKWIPSMSCKSINGILYFFLFFLFCIKIVSLVLTAFIRVCVPLNGSDKPDLPTRSWHFNIWLSLKTWKLGTDRRTLRRECLAGEHAPCDDNDNDNRNALFWEILSFQRADRNSDHVDIRRTTCEDSVGTCPSLLPSPYDSPRPHSPGSVNPMIVTFPRDRDDDEDVSQNAGSCRAVGRETRASKTKANSKISKVRDENIWERAEFDLWPRHSNSYSLALSQPGLDPSDTFSFNFNSHCTICSQRCCWDSRPCPDATEDMSSSAAGFLPPTAFSYSVVRIYSWLL